MKNICLCLLLCINLVANGQGSKKNNHFIDGDSIKLQLIADWKRAKFYTSEFLERMPADKYNTRPVDTVRTFSQQMIHLALANTGLIAMATGNKDIFNNMAYLEKTPSVQNKDSVVSYVNRSYDFAIDQIKNLPSSTLLETSNSGGAPNLTRFSLLLKAFEHQTHHRGQCVIYLRAQGIRPPDERLF